MSWWHSGALSVKQDGNIIITRARKSAFKSNFLKVLQEAVGELFRQSKIIHELLDAIPIERSYNFLKSDKSANLKLLKCSELNLFIVHSKRHHNINALKNVETLEGQATLLGKTNSGIQIAKLIQWFCLNFQQQNNRIGCRGNLLPESQFYCQYFAARLSFISRMQTLPPSSPRKFGKQYVFPSIGVIRHED